MISKSNKPLAFCFDLDFDSPNYEEEYFYAKRNTNQLKKLLKDFYELGVLPITGDILDVLGNHKDGDCIRYEITKRVFEGRIIYYNLIYTDK